MGVNGKECDGRQDFFFFLFVVSDHLGWGRKDSREWGSDKVNRCNIHEARMHSDIISDSVITERQHFVVMQVAILLTATTAVVSFLSAAWTPEVLKSGPRGRDCCSFFILPGSSHSTCIIRDLFGLGHQVNLN